MERNPVAEECPLEKEGETPVERIQRLACLERTGRANAKDARRRLQGHVIGEGRGMVDGEPVYVAAVELDGIGRRTFRCRGSGAVELDAWLEKGSTLEIVLDPRRPNALTLEPEEDRVLDLPGCLDDLFRVDDRLVVPDRAERPEP